MLIAGVTTLGLSGCGAIIDTDANYALVSEGRTPSILTDGSAEYCKVTKKGDLSDWKLQWSGTKCKASFGFEE